MASVKKKPAVKTAAAKTTKKITAPQKMAKATTARTATTKAAPVKKSALKPAAKKPAGKKAAQPLGIPEHMRDAALKILDERKAEEIVTIELAGRSSVADYMIIASGKASRQIAAIADYLREAFMKLGCPRVRIEGKGEANWVLVDCGDVIVHLFRPEVREYYDLDAIWDGKGNSK